MMNKVLLGGLLCGAALTFMGCEDPNEIGLSLQSEDQLLTGTLIDTISVNTHVVLENSEISGQNSAISTVGRYTDPEFGIVEARTFTELVPAQEDFNFGANPLCDSAILYLENYTIPTSGGVEPYIYGDSTSSQTLEVYEITETFNDDLTYLTTSSLTTNPTALGTLENFVPSPSSEKALAIDLGCTFGEKLLVNGSGSREDFQAAVPGLMIQSASNVDASILGFSSLADSTRVILYYSNDEESTSLSFDIGSNGTRFNQFSADRSATALASLTSTGDTLSTSATSNQVLLQSGTGLRTILRFPGLDEVLASNENISISFARLLLIPVEGTNTGLEDEVPALLATYEAGANGMIAEDEDGNDIWIPSDFKTINDQLDGFYRFDDDEGRYEIGMTNYFQEIVDGVRENTGIVLSSVNNSTRVTRAQLYDGDAVINGENALKLELYYTQLD